jgi:hypothetical protein
MPYWLDQCEQVWVLAEWPHIMVGSLDLCLLGEIETVRLRMAWHAFTKAAHGAIRFAVCLC